MTPAVRELEAAGVPFTVHEYDRSGARRDFGLEAADTLGLDPDQVFKTLVVTVDGTPAVAIVPVSTSLSLKKLGRAIGAKRVDMCDPVLAERITGYVLGGISPFGQKQRLRTLLDETASLFDVIYVSGGRRGLDIGLGPEAIVDVLDAELVDIALG